MSTGGIVIPQGPGRWLTSAELDQEIEDRDELMMALKDRLCCALGSATECLSCYEDRALLARIKVQR